MNQRKREDYLKKFRRQQETSIAKIQQSANEKQQHSSLNVASINVGPSAAAGQSHGHNKSSKQHTDENRHAKDTR